jgi:hypothetical protein
MREKYSSKLKQERGVFLSLPCTFLESECRIEKIKEKIKRILFFFKFFYAD